VKKSNYLTVARCGGDFKDFEDFLRISNSAFEMGADRRAPGISTLSGLCGGFTFERLSNEHRRFPRKSAM